MDDTKKNELRFKWMVFWMNRAVWPLQIHIFNVPLKYLTLVYSEQALPELIIIY